MVSVEEVTYSRDECIEAVRDFIAFATKMYLEESAFVSPPSGGWPNITHQSMQSLGKTDEVIELLRRLPYPSDPDPDRRPQVMPALAFAAWQLDKAGQSPMPYRMATEGMIFEDVPAHVVGLARRRRNDHGVLLDIQLGVVFWHEAAMEFKSFSPYPTVTDVVDSDDEDEMPEGEFEWRGCRTVWSIPDFFATLKHNFKELHFVPMSRRRVVDGWYGPGEHGQEAVDMVKGIYRAHGWPDLERYRKTECLKAVYAALREHFPGLEDEKDAELMGPS